MIAPLLSQGVTLEELGVGPVPGAPMVPYMPGNLPATFRKVPIYDGI